MRTMINLRKVLFLDRDGTICFDDGAFGSEKYDYKDIVEDITAISF